MIVGRLKTNDDSVAWLCPVSSSHESVTIEQERYWAHITERNEGKAAGTYDGRLDRREYNQPLEAGPAFVRGYKGRVAGPRLPKQSEFD